MNEQSLVSQLFGELFLASFSRVDNIAYDTKPYQCLIVLLSN